MNLTPEAAVQVCEAPTALALRAKDPGFASLVLEPAATSRVERRSTYVGRQPLAMVVAGHGTARQNGSGTQRRLLSLPDRPSRRGGVRRRDPAERQPPSWPSATTRRPDSSRLACLSDLLRAAERGLAEAEAKAVVRARSGQPRSKRAEVEEPAATSIGAWRVYRDAECDRQRDADPERSTDLYQACRVGLTRDRVRQLGL